MMTCWQDTQTAAYKQAKPEVKERYACHQAVGDNAATLKGDVSGAEAKEKLCGLEETTRNCDASVTEASQFAAITPTLDVIQENLKPSAEHEARLIEGMVRPKTVEAPVSVSAVAHSQYTNPNTSEGQQQAGPPSAANPRLEVPYNDSEENLTDVPANPASSHENKDATSRLSSRLWKSSTNMYRLQGHRRCPRRQRRNHFSIEVESRPRPIGIYRFETDVIGCLRCSR